MQITKIQTTQPKKSHHALAAAVGAMAGAVGTFVLPNKAELKELKVDTFISKTAMSNRAADRSMLKFIGVGALAALGINALVKAVKSHNSAKKDEAAKIEYSKWDALIDASDYACMVTWYNDNIR